MSTLNLTAPAISYDAVPYTSQPFARSHPMNVQTMAHLFGLESPPAGACRVLELGCASGGNIIPAAEALPGSQFLGIDFSARQIADGQAWIKTLGLTNVELRCASILDIDDSWGQFDYIIVHGVFSWVPANVRQKILEISSRNLTPNGVAYISYNVYPGWRMRGTLRDVMCYHARKAADPSTRVKMARQIVDLLVQANGDRDTAYMRMLKEEAAIVAKQNDNYILHEHMEEVNDPMYFHEFAALAKTHNLQFLSESSLPVMVPGNLGPEVGSMLTKLTRDLVEMEQYMDFVRNRMFRQSLLCHANHRLVRNLNGSVLRGVHLVARAGPAKPVDFAPGVPAQFNGPQGVQFTATHPVLKAALVCLSEKHPCGERLEDLVVRAAERVNHPLPEQPEERDRFMHAVASDLLQALSVDAIEAQVYPPPMSNQLGDRPLVSKVARFQCDRGLPVTTLRHEVLNPAELDRQIIRLLDGTNDRAAIVKSLVNRVLAGAITMNENNKPLPKDDPRIPDLMGKAVDDSLRRIIGWGLLLKHD